MCGCFSHAPCWGPGPQPRHVPWLGIELATLWFTGWQSVHQPGWYFIFYVFHLFLSRLCVQAESVSNSLSLTRPVALAYGCVVAKGLLSSWEFNVLGFCPVCSIGRLWVHLCFKCQLWFWHRLKTQICMCVDNHDHPYVDQGNVFILLVVRKQQKCWV